MVEQGGQTLPSQWLNREGRHLPSEWLNKEVRHIAGVCVGVVEQGGDRYRSIKIEGPSQLGRQHLIYF